VAAAEAVVIRSPAWKAEGRGGGGQHGELRSVDGDARAVNGEDRAHAAQLLDLVQVGRGHPAGYRGDHVGHHQVRRDRPGEA
jgi:hypothetical protein